MATLHFDATQVEPASAKDPVPAGKYLAVITASEMKPTRSGAGQYLELEYQIVEGDHRGRKIWSRHNLTHPNEKVVQIARGELSAICHAVGIMTPKDSAELHNLPLTVTVTVKKRDDNGGPANEVLAWAKKSVATGAPQQVTGSTPPWLRR